MELASGGEVEVEEVAVAQGAVEEGDLIEQARVIGLGPGEGEGGDGRGVEGGAGVEGVAEGFAAAVDVERGVADDGAREGEGDAVPLVVAQGRGGGDGPAGDGEGEAGVGAEGEGGVAAGGGGVAPADESAVVAGEVRGAEANPRDDAPRPGTQRRVEAGGLGVAVGGPVKRAAGSGSKRRWPGCPGVAW